MPILSWDYATTRARLNMALFRISILKGDPSKARDINRAALDATRLSKGLVQLDKNGKSELDRSMEDYSRRRRADMANGE